MYLPISAAIFTEIVALARAVISSRTTLPALSGVRLSVDPATPRRLTIVATDLDIYLTRTFDLATPAVPGNLLIPARELGTIRPDKNTEVVIHQREQWKIAVTATQGGALAVHHLEALDMECFPDDPPAPPPLRVIGPASRMDDLLSRTVLSAATLDAITASLPFQSEDETRYVLCGCLLEPSAVIATDGRRLVKFTVSGPPVPIILPTKVCELLAKLKSTSAILTMPLSEPEHATIRLGTDLSIYTKLIAGNYPNYRQVIPELAEDRITFADPVPVIKFLRRLDSKSKHSAVQLTPLPSFRLELRHHDATLITPAVFTGHPVPIAFNPSMLADMLETVGHTFSYDGNLSPGLFTAPDKVGVLMCMRTIADEPVPAVTEAQPAEAAA